MGVHPVFLRAVLYGKYELATVPRGPLVAGLWWWEGLKQSRGAEGHMGRRCWSVGSNCVNNKCPRRAHRTGCTQGALWPWTKSCFTDAAQVICCLAFLVLQSVSKKEYLKKESSYKESSYSVIYTWTEISSGWSNVNSG